VKIVTAGSSTLSAQTGSAAKENWRLLVMVKPASAASAGMTVRCEDDTPG
jgi:hypothetical protein